MARNASGTWIGFAAMAFVVAALSGVFTTYALPIPMHRALAVDAALDEALAAAGSPDPAAEIAAIAPRLGDSAAPIMQGTGSWAARVQAERAAMRVRFLDEEAATATRLRWLAVVICLVGALFVGAVVGGLSRRPPGPAA